MVVLALQVYIQHNQEAAAVAADTDTHTVERRRAVAPGSSAQATIDEDDAQVVHG